MGPNSTRARRRQAALRAKLRATRLMFYIQKMDRESITPARVGAVASMHGTCPCWMCTHRHDGPPHRDVRRAPVMAG